MKKNHLFIFVIALFAFIKSVSQDKPIHEQGPFVDESGKLFWQKGKPLYLFVSENLDGTDTKILKSERSKNYTNPMYLDTEGINFIRSNWAIDENGIYAEPKQEILFEIYNDGIAPVSSSTINGASYKKSEKNYFEEKVTIKLSSRDQLSGVRSIMYSINGGPFEGYTGSLIFSDDKKYSINYYAIDNVGNVEEPKNIQFSIDKSSPETKHTISGDQSENILSPRSKIELSAIDEGSEVQSTFYSLDDAKYIKHSSDISLTNYSEGNHTLKYYSIDKVGNQEEPKEYTFYLDRTVPEVIASVVGDQYQNRGRVFVSTRSKVKLEASDNKAGIKNLGYIIDNGEERVYRGPFELPKSKNKLEIVYFATDNVNNDFRTVFDEKVSGRQALDIDMKAPKIDYSYKGNSHIIRDTSFITGKTLIGLNATDDDSGVKSIGYKINGGAGKDYNEPFTIVEEGHYTVDFYGTDQVNNRNISAFTFVVDNTGPEIESILSMEPIGIITLEEFEDDIPVYSSGIKLYLAATDGVVDTDRIYYSLNESEEKLYSSPININLKGLNSFKIRALDKLGNESESELKQIFIK